MIMMISRDANPSDMDALRSRSPLLIGLTNSLNQAWADTIVWTHGSQWQRPSAAHTQAHGTEGQQRQQQLFKHGWGEKTTTLASCGSSGVKAGARRPWVADALSQSQSSLAGQPAAGAGVSCSGKRR